MTGNEGVVLRAATSAPAAAQPALAIDRYFYTAMAALFITVALIGFTPTSLVLVSAVMQGTRPPPPLPLHFHAVAMTSWLVLLLVQTSLMSKGRASTHRKLGMAWCVAAPAVLVSLVIMSTVPIYFISRMTDAEVVQFGVNVDGVWGFFATQLQAVLLFGLFASWGFGARRTDPAAHKRLMILATVTILGAAFGRMVNATGFLPGADLFPSHLVPDLYLLALLVPPLIYDLIQRGAVHKTYVVGLALMVSMSVLAHYLHYADWWLAIGRDVMR
jgi:hypothetical protein